MEGKDTQENLLENSEMEPEQELEEDLFAGVEEEPAEPEQSLEQEESFSLLHCL